MDIMPKLAKLAFKDYDTHLQLGLERKNCMVTVQAGSRDPEVLNPMKWDAGVDHAGMMNLLFMLHFGHSLHTNTYVKKILVCFHRGCLWHDQPYPVNIELILAIIGLPEKGHDLLP